MCEIWRFEVNFLIGVAIRPKRRANNEVYSPDVGRITLKSLFARRARAGLTTRHASCTCGNEQW